MTTAIAINGDALSRDQTSPAAAYLASLASGHSRRAMAQSLRVIVILATDGALGDPASFPWHELTAAHTMAIRAELVRSDAAPATVNRHLSALRGVLRSAWRLGLMNADDYHRAADVACIEAESIDAGRMLNEGELQAIFRTVDGDAFRDARDRAILAVMYGCGLRRSEVCGLAVDDASDSLLVRRGKGAKPRLVPVSHWVRQALAAWLEARGNEPGVLFVSAGDVVFRPLTPQTVMDVCERRARLAGIESFTPHDLRRSFISNLLTVGVDSSTIQRLAGHRDVRTTMRYDRRPMDEQRRGVQRLVSPME